MASSCTDIPNLDLGGGLVTAEPPLLKQGEWYKQQNVRWDPEKRMLRSMNSLAWVIVTGKEQPLVLPTKMGAAHLLFLGMGPPYRISSDFTSWNVLTYDDGSAYTYVNPDGLKGSDWPLWGLATARYNGYIWMTNELNKLVYTDGTCIRKYTNETQPAGRYLMSFFDHLVIGWPTYEGFAYPWRVMWSDLYGPNRWAPQQGRECDNFDLIDWSERLPLYNGITGLSKGNDQGRVYTANAIVGMRYVGLPKIMQFSALVDDIGCTSPKSLVSYNGTDYFYSEKENNFFAFDGQRVRPIGDSIREFLKDYVVSGISFFFASCAMVYERYNEIQWFFAATTSGSRDGDKGIAYNMQTGRWHEISNTLSSGRIVGATPVNLTLAKKGAQLTGLANALTGIMEQLGTGGLAVSNIYLTYGTAAPAVWKETTAASTTFGTPLLETGDRFYGDLFSMKETTAMTIHGSCTNGIKVSLSTRDNLTDSVTFAEVGTYLGTEPQNRLTFPRRAGRIFRWRFEAVTDDGSFNLQSFVEHIYGAKSEA